MTGVSRTGRIRHDLPNELVLLVDVDRKLVPVITFAVLLRPGGVRVFLTALRGRPIRRRRLLINDLSFLPADLLLRRGNQSGIDHLATPGDKAFL